MVVVVRILADARSLKAGCVALDYDFDCKHIHSCLVTTSAAFGAGIHASYVEVMIDSEVCSLNQTIAYECLVLVEDHLRVTRKLADVVPEIESIGQSRCLKDHFLV